MTAARKEQLFNKAETTLSSAVNATQTSITVADGSIYPPVGDFRIIIDDELMLVTARSGNNLTVERAKENTTGASHSSGASVKHIVTAEGALRFVRQSIPFFGLLRPYHSLTDANHNYLTAADFTQLNFFTGTNVADENGAIVFEGFTPGGSELQIIHKPAPATPYTLYVAAWQYGAANADVEPGPIFRESSTGRIIHFTNWLDSSNPEVAVFKWSSPTSFSTTANTVNAEMYLPAWYKMEDDGTNITFSFSSDGIHFEERWSEARGTFFSTGPDQIGFAWNQKSSAEQVAVILHWSEEK